MTDFRDLAKEMDGRWKDDEPVPPPEPWQRGRGTSLLRTLVGIVVFGFVAWALSTYLAFDHPDVIESGSYKGTDYAVAQAALLGLATGYILWAASWLDHLMAKHGSLPTFLAVAGGGLLIESLMGNFVGLFGSAGIMMLIVVFAFTYCVENAIVPNSFENMKRSFRPF